MEDLVSEQALNQFELNRCVTNLKKTAKDKRTEGFLHKKLEELDGLWKSIKVLDRKMLAIYTKADEARPYFKDNMFDALEEIYWTGYEFICENLKSFKLPQQPMTPSPSNSAITEATDLQLPRITIPRFSGTYQSWSSFRDLFMSLVHNNKNLSNVQKMHYLKSSISGEAEQLIRHLQITDTNYSSAWEILVKRYQNERVLVNTQLQVLTSLPNLTNENASSLKRLVDVTNECLESLKGLNVDVKSWDPLLIYLLTQKLSRETIAHWEASLSARENPAAIPKLTEFCAFIESRFRTLEAINCSKGAAVKPDLNSTSKQHHRTRSFVTGTTFECPICSKDHRIRQCPKFLAMAVRERHEFIKKQSRCFNCLSTAHSSDQCPNPMNCQRCGRRHNTLLHLTQPSNRRLTHLTNSRVEATNLSDQRNRTERKFKSHHIPQPLSEDISQTVKQPEPSAPPQEYIQNHYTNSQGRKIVLLATALVEVITPRAGKQTLRVLLDQGSQASFITESAVQRLMLKKKPTYAIVTGIGSKETEKAHSVISCHIQSRLTPDYQRCVDAFVLNSITGLIPSHQIETQSLRHLDGINLADPTCLSPGNIDMLLGAEIYGEILCEGVIKGPKGTPIAQKTLLGWILSGQLNETKVDHHSINHAPAVNSSEHSISLHCELTVEELLKQFWEVENISTDRKPLTTDEEDCEKLYTNTTERDHTGRYIVKLPFKGTDNLPSLGESRYQAAKRFYQMERRFQVNPELYADYANFMKEYMTLGHMERVSSLQDNSTFKSTPGKYYYLPHHAVLKTESSTTKLRVVFDASSKTTNNKSLNDNLHVGPTLQEDLTDILLRWRKYRVAITADIEKMYRQIKVDSQHCDFQRVLWRTSTHDELQEYRLLTVTYGTACAPYLAIRTLQQLATDEKDDFPLASQVTLTDFYVDDLMTGTNSVEEAIKLQTELRGLMNRGGFNLRKWASNNQELMENVPINDREVKEPLTIDFKESIKTLGIRWNPATDSFFFKVYPNSPPAPLTKRKFLSEAAKLFDPLGWLAPTIICVKIIFQKLWLAGIDWDDQLPNDVACQWERLRNDLPKIESIRIPRWIALDSITSTCELHAFCDASMYAYAAVVYTRCVDQNGVVTITLLTAKTKVAPIQQISIPRLELCGAVLLTKLVQQTKRALKIDSLPVYAWTDSLNVLAWLRGHPRQWKTFVANRVSLIQSHLNNEHWRYVRSTDNPADCASRGVPPGELEGHPLWWSGPSWLTKPPTAWPKHSSELVNTDLEMKRVVLLTTGNNDAAIQLLTRFSQLNRLIRVVAYCLRFFTNLKTSNMHRNKNELQASELNNATNVIIKIVQQHSFGAEYKTLENNQQLHTKSRILSLNPTLDQQGIIRVGGRLKHAQLSFDKICPILLPEKGPFTEMLIDDAHRTTLHGGVQLTLNFIRKKYWIVNGRNAVRLRIRKCITCFRYKATPTEQLMGDLPEARVNIHRPFLHTGVDFTGHINLRESKTRGRIKTSKGYIAVFICLTTKAIHLEVVSDLSTDAFLAAFRRFTSRRGLCSDLYSDCGSNFIGANKRLVEARYHYEHGLPEELKAVLAMKGIQWHFIPPASPHFGGLWEAGVKSTKHHLKRVIGDSLLTFEELTTVLAQIEACLNSRPLYPISDDPNDYSALTPGHFLIGDTLLCPPEPSLLDKSISSLKRWHLLQRMYQHFWKRWLTEYLPRLQTRTKWRLRAQNVKEGTLVLIKDERMPPARWLLGRIIETHPGPDGLVRAATIKCKENTLKRPVTKICILPIPDNEKHDTVLKGSIQ